MRGSHQASRQRMHTLACGHARMPCMGVCACARNPARTCAGLVGGGGLHVPRWLHWPWLFACHPMQMALPMACDAHKAPQVGTPSDAPRVDHATRRTHAGLDHRPVLQQGNHRRRQQPPVRMLHWLLLLWRLKRQLWGGSAAAAGMGGSGAGFAVVGQGRRSGAQQQHAPAARADLKHGDPARQRQRIEGKQGRGGGGAWGAL